MTVDQLSSRTLAGKNNWLGRSQHKSKITQIFGKIHQEQQLQVQISSFKSCFFSYKCAKHDHLFTYLHICKEMEFPEMLHQVHGSRHHLHLWFNSPHQQASASAFCELHSHRHATCSEPPQLCTSPSTGPGDSFPVQKGFSRTPHSLQREALAAVASELQTTEKQLCCPHPGL